MVTHFDQQIKLTDEHTLGYAEYGDPQGKPILYFHGMPSSRMEGNLPVIDEIATRLGARILILERPGVGLSDFWPYKIIDWPDTVVEFADRLNLTRFSIMGLSSGGKYVAACAWKIPHRLESACIVSGNAPVEIPEVINSMTGQDRQLYWFARYTNGLLRFLLDRIARNTRIKPESILGLFSDLSAPDKVALERDEIMKLLQDMITGAFQSGTKGVAWDWKLEALPWGFSVSDISMPVILWHGEEDMLVPVAHGRYLSRTLPNCHAHFVPAEGHISLIVNHFNEILDEVISQEI